MPRRKFIDKKECVTFHLGHRSQKDPLITDATAPQRILIPFSQSENDKYMKDNSKLRKKQKYGIFFDDDYSYLQHLKDNILRYDWEEVNGPHKKIQNFVDNEEIKIKLPSSVFESQIEEKVGLLNKQIKNSGLQLDLDTDVIAALDDDFDFDNPDNVLEDNFIELATNKNCTSNIDKYCSVHNNRLLSNTLLLLDEEVDNADGASDHYEFKEIETNSYFTQYSISSNVIRRNKQLMVLDDIFEKTFADYSQNEIGALDYEDFVGHVETKLNVLNFEDKLQKHQLQDNENLKKLMNSSIKIHKENEIDRFEELIVESRHKHNWDCESILTTYSNLYNHPKLISELKDVGNIDTRRTDISKIVSNGRFQCAGTTHIQPYIESGSSISSTTCAVIPSHSLNKSLAEKRERKLAVKSFRKKRRQERKSNIDAFKNEKKRQDKILLNEKKNIPGSRIL